MADIIKFYCIFLCCTYISFRIMNHTIKYLIHKIAFFLLSFIFASLSHVLSSFLPKLEYILPIILLWISISIFTLQPQASFISTIIAFEMSLVTHAFSSFISILIIAPLHYRIPFFSYPMYALVSSILQIMLIFAIFRIKRFHKGMPFLFTTTFINIATSICLFLIVFITNTPTKLPSLWIQVISPFIFITSLAILIYWWQTQLTKTYKRRLLFRELESLRTEVQEKDKLIEKLTEQNQELGRLIHWDNKRIPAMEHAVCDFLISGMENHEGQQAKGNELIEVIRSLSRNRANTLSDINYKRCKQYVTRILSLDALLNLTEKQALEENITFSVHIAVELTDYVPRFISAEDLTHALSDLLENALIATRYSCKRKIQLQFYELEKAFVLEIADSGIPFEVRSLVNLGLTQLTTHADTGGSGIGLVDIWRIKEHYGATLHIEEYENTSPYSKKISMIFNKKHQYTIRSFRKDEILKKNNRTDLQIFEIN